jgi:hypothetical protein
LRIKFYFVQIHNRRFFFKLTIRFKKYTYFLRIIIAPSKMLSTLYLHPIVQDEKARINCTFDPRVSEFLYSRMIWVLPPPPPPSDCMLLPPRGKPHSLGHILYCYALLKPLRNLPFERHKHKLSLYPFRK